MLLPYAMQLIDHRIGGVQWLSTQTCVGLASVGVLAWIEDKVREKERLFAKKGKDTLTRQGTMCKRASRTTARGLVLILGGTCHINRVASCIASALD